LTAPVRVVILAAAGPSFMVHQFMDGTKTAMDALAERRRLGSMRQLIAARDRGVAGRRAR